MSENPQTQLGSFSGSGTGTDEHDDPAYATSGTEEAAATANTEGSAATAPQSTTPAKLQAFRRQVQDVLGRQYPDAITEFEFFVRVEEGSETFATSELPDEVPLAPTRIGRWTLDFHSKKAVTYRATAHTYDERFGDGAAIVRHRICLNDSGANADGMWLHRVEKKTGYENPGQLKGASTNESDMLVGSTVPGFDVNGNDGDHAFSSGVYARFESPGTALANLVARLHTEPVPVRRLLPDPEPTAWTPTRLEPQTAVWEHPPEDTRFDAIQLRLSNGSTPATAYLRGVLEDEPLPHQPTVPVPIPDTVPAPCVEQTETRTKCAGLCVLPPVVRGLFQEDIPALLTDTGDIS